MEKVREIKYTHKVLSLHIFINIMSNTTTSFLIVYVLKKKNEYAYEWVVRYLQMLCLIPSPYFNLLSLLC